MNFRIPDFPETLIVHFLAASPFLLIGLSSRQVRRTIFLLAGTAITLKAVGLDWLAYTAAGYLFYRLQQPKMGIALAVFLAFITACLGGVLNILVRLDQPAWAALWRPAGIIATVLMMLAITVPLSPIFGLLGVAMARQSCISWFARIVRRS